MQSNANWVKVGSGREEEPCAVDDEGDERHVPSPDAVGHRTENERADGHTEQSRTHDQPQRRAGEPEFLTHLVRGEGDREDVIAVEGVEERADGDDQPLVGRHAGRVDAFT